MKIGLFTLVIAAAVFSAITACSSKATKGGGTRYKARFEVAGMCSNYTFSVIEGRIDPLLVAATWTNPQTNKTYWKAFGISNPCDFPSGIKEGDVFYFEIVPAKKDPQCAVCMAYYPTPERKLNIKVVQ
ncbi:hypothetical protein [Niabella drilacis]|uniref:Uncharacterized protein n=1 Tax=Niabella drilacis (strain DSM 25811 / CCM 8410 / CCUG 62505 / LMG 26954 / E90) TaxID=1285928 RepID=A0A1G6SN66_NIADE|nr:hypothetical protein [Niabella drilacis]SDD17667.1 hypothetical protein SAMN04487894_106273 [Niabella drilacis]